MDVEVVRYGPDPSQLVELTRADVAGAPVAVLVHGGFWKAAYGAEYARPLVPSLVSRGWSTVVVEYRRVGNGGGYRATLEDVAGAVDSLANLDLPTGTVVAVGHSAGGQLAAWLATRQSLPDGAPGARPHVVPTAVVAQAGVLDLRAAARDRLGSDAVVGFLGGPPDAVGDRYEIASPVERLPLGVPLLCIHAAADTIVPPDQSERFARLARDAGDAVDLLEVEGDHFTVIDSEGAAWSQTLEWMEQHRVSAAS